MSQELIPCKQALVGESTQAGVEDVVIKATELLETRLATLQDQIDDNQPFAFSPDSRFLALGGENCDTSVLSLNNWQKLQLLETGVDHMVTYDDSENAGGSMAFSWDGSLLATALQGGEVKIWRVLDRTLVHTILDHCSLTDAPGVSLAFSPDGRFLVTSGLGITHLWGVWP